MYASLFFLPNTYYDEQESAIGAKIFWGQQIIRKDEDSNEEYYGNSARIDAHSLTFFPPAYTSCIPPPTFSSPPPHPLSLAKRKSLSSKISDIQRTKAKEFVTQSEKYMCLPEEV